MMNRRLNRQLWQFFLLALILFSNARARAFDKGAWKERALRYGKRAYAFTAQYPEPRSLIDPTCALMLSGNMDKKKVSNAKELVRNFRRQLAPGSGFRPPRVVPEFNRWVLANQDSSPELKDRWDARLAGIQAWDHKVKGSKDRTLDGTTEQTIVFTGEDEINAYLGMAEYTRSKLRNILANQDDQLNWISRWNAFNTNINLAYFAGYAAFQLATAPKDSALAWALTSGLLFQAVFFDIYGMHGELLTRRQNIDAFENQAREYLTRGPAGQSGAWVGHGRTHRVNNGLLKSIFMKDLGHTAQNLKLQRMLDQHWSGRPITRYMTKKRQPQHIDEVNQMITRGYVMVDHLLFLNEDLPIPQPQLVLTVRSSERKVVWQPYLKDAASRAKVVTAVPPSAEDANDQKAVVEEDDNAVDLPPRKTKTSKPARSPRPKRSARAKSTEG